MTRPAKSSRPTDEPDASTRDTAPGGSLTDLMDALRRSAFTRRFGPRSKGRETTRSDRERSD